MTSLVATARWLMATVLVLAVVPMSGTVQAQESNWSIVTDPRMVVIPSRAMTEINGDITNAQANRQLALDRKDQAQARRAEIERFIETRKTALQDIKRRRGTAKSNGRESELLSLQLETKATEQAIDLLNRLKDLRRTEIEQAEAQVEQAELELKVLNLESELLGRRIEYDSLATSGSGALRLSTAQQVLRELEVRLLKLAQEHASATQKVANKQKEVMNQRTKLHQAQLKLGVPRA